MLSVPCCGAPEDCGGAAAFAAATEAAAAAAAALPAVPTVAACAATFAADAPRREAQQVHQQQQRSQQDEQPSTQQQKQHCEQQQHGRQQYPASLSVCARRNLAGDCAGPSEAKQHAADDFAGRPGCSSSPGGNDGAEEPALPAATFEAPSTNALGMNGGRRAAATPRKPELQQTLLRIQGRQVAVLSLRFSDRYFLTVSDNGKMSALLRGSTGFEETRADIGVSFLFGDRKREYFLVYARALLSLIQQRSNKQQVDLLLAISVQDDSPAFFKQVMQGIEGHFHFA